MDMCRGRRGQTRVARYTVPKERKSIVLLSGIDRANYRQKNVLPRSQKHSAPHEIKHLQNPICTKHLYKLHMSVQPWRKRLGVGFSPNTEGFIQNAHAQSNAGNVKLGWLSKPSLCCVGKYSPITFRSQRQELTLLTRAQHCC